MNARYLVSDAGWTLQLLAGLLFVFLCGQFCWSSVDLARASFAAPADDTDRRGKEAPNAAASTSNPVSSAEAAEGDQTDEHGRYSFDNLRESTYTH